MSPETRVERTWQSGGPSGTVALFPGKWDGTPGAQIPTEDDVMISRLVAAAATALLALLGPGASAADRAAFCAKNKEIGPYDLLDAVTAKRVKLEDVGADDLPASMKRLRTLAERRSFLDRVAAHRAKLYKEAMALEKKRTDALAFARKVIEATDIIKEDYVRDVNQGQMVVWAVRGLYDYIEEKVPRAIEDELKDARTMRPEPSRAGR